MTDTSYRPEQQIEQAAPEPAERPALESRVAQAEPASDAVPSAPEQSEQRQLQSAVADRAYEPQVEAQSKVAAATDAVPEVSGIRDVPVSQINNPEINGPEDFRQRGARTVVRFKQDPSIIVSIYCCPKILTRPSRNQKVASSLVADYNPPTWSADCSPLRAKRSLSIVQKSDW